MFTFYLCNSTVQTILGPVETCKAIVLFVCHYITAVYLKTNADIAILIICACRQTVVGLFTFCGPWVTCAFLDCAKNVDKKCSGSLRTGTKCFQYNLAVNLPPYLRSGSSLAITQTLLLPAAPDVLHHQHAGRERSGATRYIQI